MPLRQPVHGRTPASIQLILIIMQMQRTILWIVFSLSLVLLWDAWQLHVGNPSLFGGRPPATQGQTAAGGPSAANGAAGATRPADAGIPGAGALASSAASPGAGDTTTPAAPASPVTATGAAQAGTRGKVFELTNDVLALQVQAQGAVLTRAELLKHLEIDKSGNVVLFNDQPGKFYVAQSGMIGAPAGAEGFPTHYTVFQPVEPATPGKLTLAAESGGIRIVREYSLSPGSYVINVVDRVSNLSGESLSPILYRQLTRDNHQPPGDTMFYSTYAGPVIYEEVDKFKKIPFDTIMSRSAKHAGVTDNGWLGIIQHYFVAAWLPAATSTREFYTQNSSEVLASIGFKQALGSLAPGQSIENAARLYIGPQDQKTMGALAPGLELTVDYGWLTIIAKPIHGLLEFLHGIVGNWGWAIVVLTLIIKTLFFPLQAASYRSMARMKAVTPRLTALRERYGDDKAKLNQAMMELYKTEKINPLGGCLPILVQIPVFISLYWVLQASVEMRGAPWLGWIQDLASPDPYFILPALMAISMFVQVKLNPKPPDPMQAKIMMFMPIIFSVMFFFFPAGLVLYWLVNNLYSIAQQWVITRKIVDSPMS